MYLSVTGFDVVDVIEMNQVDLVGSRAHLVFGLKSSLSTREET